MAAKKKSTNTSMNLICVLAMALGIYLVINGVLSGATDTTRMLMLTAGLVAMITGVIGFRSND
jgi:hypothetical protein